MLGEMQGFYPLLLLFLFQLYEEKRYMTMYFILIEYKVYFCIYRLGLSVLYYCFLHLDTLIDQDLYSNAFV